MSGATRAKTLAANSGLLAFALLLVLWTVTAEANSRDPGAGATVTPGPSSEPFPHSTVNSPSARRFARGAQERRFRTGDGYSIRIATRHYPDETEKVAALLSSLEHGAEIGKLNVYVATGDELQRVCGAGMMACYDPWANRIFVPGEAEAAPGIPREVVIAHEYGHHIANHRRGDTFAAIEAGTKGWSTYEGVCELARGGEVFPGNGGAHYWENPGEAFAQAYAELSTPEVDSQWYYSPLLEPDAAALAAIRSDIRHPWSGPRTRVWRGRVGPGKPPRSGGPAIGLSAAEAVDERVIDRVIPTRFDGRVTVRLRGREGGRYRLTLREREGGRALARTSSRRSGVAVLTYSSCGTDSVLLEVRRLGPGGSFEARIAAP